MANYHFDYSHILNQVVDDVSDNLEEIIQQKLGKGKIEEIVKKTLSGLNVNIGDIADDVLADIITNGITNAFNGVKLKASTKKIELDIDDYISLNKKDLLSEINNLYEKAEDAIDQGNKELGKSLHDSFVKAASVAVGKGYLKETDEMYSELIALTNEKQDELVETIKKGDFEVKNAVNANKNTANAKAWSKMYVEIQAQIATMKEQKEQLNNLWADLQDKIPESVSDEDYDSLVNIWKSLSKDIMNGAVSLDEAKSKLQASYNSILNIPNDTVQTNTIENLSEAYAELYKEIQKVGDVAGLDLTNQKLRETLEELKLLSEESKELQQVQQGHTNKGGLIGENSVVLLRNNTEENLQKAKQLMTKLNEAYENGVNVARIIDVINDGSETFMEIQEKMSGTVLGNGIDTINFDFLEATDEQINKFAADIKKLQDLGVGVDINLSNIFYDKQKGFGFIDLDLTPAMYENVEDFLDDFRGGIIGEIEYECEEMNKDLDKLPFAENFFDKFTKGFKDALSVHSPSKETAKIADDTVDGFINEVDKRLPEVKQVGEKIGDAVKEGIKDSLQSATIDEDDIDSILGSNALTQLGYEIKANNVSKQESSIADFWKEFGTPSDALDAGAFSKVREVLDFLGGKFAEMNDEADDFTERKLNAEFFKELIEQLDLSEDKLNVIKHLIYEIEAIEPGGKYEHLASKDKEKASIINANNSYKMLDDIRDIINGIREVTQEEINAANLIMSSESPILSEVEKLPIQVEEVNSELEKEKTLYDQIYERIEKIRMLGVVGGTKDEVGETYGYESKNLEAYKMQMEAIKTLTPAGWKQNPDVRDAVLNPDLSIEEVTRRLVQAAEDYTVCKKALDDLFTNAGITGGKVFDDAYRTLDMYSFDSEGMFGVIGDVKEKLSLIKQENQAREEARQKKEAEAQAQTELNKQKQAELQLDKNPISAEIVQTEQQLAEETAKANSVMEEQKQKIAELEEQVDDLRSSLKAQGDELAHANEEYGNMMDELGRANDREDMLSEELLQQQQISEELREQNNTLKEQVENHQHEVESLQEVLKEEQEHVALTEEELDKQRTLAETYKMSVENERQVRKEAEQRADAYEEISRIAASGEAETDEKMRLEIEARQEAEKQLDIKKEENEELKKKLDLTEQIVNESKTKETKVDSGEVSNIKAVQNAIKKKNNAFKAEEKTVDKSVTNEINKLKELEKVISENIPNAIDKKNDAFIGENEIVKQVIAEEKKTIKQSAPKESTGKTKSTSNNSFIKAYNTQFEKLKKAIASDKNIITDEIQEFYDVLSGKDIKSESSDAIKQYTDDIKNLLATIEKRGNETKLLKNINDATNTLQKNTAMPKKLARDYQQLIDEMQAMVEAGGYTNKQVAEMTQRLIRLNTAFANTGKSGRSFFGMIANDVKTSSARLIAQYMSFQDLIRYARSAVQAVTQLDTALTQLRVVSGASETELNRVAKSAYNMANALGSTTTEITNSITEWRRLGYSIEESQKLAEQAAKLSTGGLMDVSSATTSLISSMQAFEMTADEVSNVVDQYIFLGNNFAISSEQLATSLTKSMAALKVAGNSLEEIEALEVAGNTIVQDADVVSNSLKVNLCLHIWKHICYVRLNVDNNYIG